ncbi:MAG: sulfatase-like hydrolase/transferase [Akkermansiaceae bacterium]
MFLPLKISRITLSLILAIAIHADEPAATDLFGNDNLSQWWPGNNEQPGKWTIKDGVILRGDAKTGGLNSKVKPFNFDLTFEWKIAEGGNSGIKYRNGLEYQLLDDERHIRGKTPNSSAAALYDLVAPIADKPSKPTGQWNTGRIIANGNHLEHWLNGVKVLEIEQQSADWKKRLQASKYKDKPDFGTKASGFHLQDHGANVHFRKVHLLSLPYSAAPVDLRAEKSKGGGVTRSRPNIVLIMADDIGLGDISHHVRTQLKKDPIVETPNLDALARQSLWFTDGHSATALCSPTRYCVMSGNNNYRSYAPWGVWGTFRESPFKKGEVTIGTVTRDAGYHTGFVGKWHLGGDFRDIKTGGIFRSTKRGDIVDQVDVTKMLGGGPKDCGFDYDFTLPCGVQGPVYTAYENQEWYPLRKDSKIIFFNKDTAAHPKDVTSKGPGPGDSHWDARELGKIVSQKGSDFIKAAPADKPFFLYYCTHAVHVPHCPPDEFDGQKIKGTTPSQHLDMIVELDLQVKRLIDALKAKGVYENTLIIFTSDNGGLMVDKATAAAGHDVAGGFNGSKNSPLEGGHRVPLFAFWKNKITPGTTDEPAINQDMLATFAALLGIEIPADQAQDSLNLLPLLTGEGTFKQRPWMVQQAGSKKEIIYRKAPWKLIIQSNHKRDSFVPKALFNLEKDSAEKGNLLKNPAQKARVDAMLKEYLGILNSKERTAPRPSK